MVEQQHHAGAHHAGRDVVEHDAPAAREVLVEPADRRRLHDVEQPEHDEADRERRPARAVDREHRDQVAGDLVDHDPLVCRRCPTRGRHAPRVPDPEQRHRHCHEAELPDRQRRQRPRERDRHGGAAGAGRDRRVARAERGRDELREQVHAPKQYANCKDFRQLPGSLPPFDLGRSAGGRDNPISRLQVRLSQGPRGSVLSSSRPRCCSSRRWRSPSSSTARAVRAGRAPEIHGVKHNQLFGPFFAGYLVWLIGPLERLLVGRVSPNADHGALAR